ncbi:hypothetical protein [Geodermatophilus sp. TF02-6]|uniref:hypothetical protein n=1 Tax=Geodermatophilus sp. TF02-6 TaxID=2250575 RepID=UPI0011BEF5FA|nr:hypothetical protein [Geodermatophilus sp. TF02-6]
MLEQVAGTASSAVVGAALVAALVALATTRHPPLAIGVLLDLLVAAGLLRLVGNPSWQAVVTAGVILVLRRLVGAGFRAARRSWSGGGEGPGRRPAARRRLELLDRLVRPAWRL